MVDLDVGTAHDIQEDVPLAVEGLMAAHGCTSYLAFRSSATSLFQHSTTSCAVSLLSLSGSWGSFLRTADAPTLEELQGETDRQYPISIQLPEVSPQHWRVDVFMSMEFDHDGEPFAQWLMLDYFAVRA